jgi:hypothetical protein
MAKAVGLKCFLQQWLLHALLACVAILGCDHQQPSARPSPALTAAIERSPGVTTETSEQPCPASRTSVALNHRSRDNFYADWSSNPEHSQPSTEGDPHLDVRDIGVGWDPDDEHTTRFIAFCEANGMKLRRHGQSGYWRVIDPQVRGCVLEVRIRAFADTASLQQMRALMLQINLAFGLNYEARIAMSLPRLAQPENGTLDPKETSEIQSSEDYNRQVDRLKRLFLEFKPGRSTTTDPAAEPSHPPESAVGPDTNGESSPPTR